MTTKKEALQILENALRLALLCKVYEGEANRVMRDVYSKPSKKELLHAPVFDSNYPLKVPCPDCNAAIGAKCTEAKFALGSTRTNVDWFHFSRIDRAILNGMNQFNRVEFDAKIK
jgi:hypothetical protein